MGRFDTLVPAAPSTESAELTPTKIYAEPELYVPPTHFDHRPLAETEAKLSDGHTVRWRNAALSCSCPASKNNPAIPCKHILEVYTSGLDGIKEGGVQVRIFMSREGHSVIVHVDDYDIDGFREVAYGDPLQKNQIIGYVREDASRKDIRPMLIPYVYAWCKEVLCDNCGYPPAMTAAGVPPSSEDILAVIKEGIYIRAHDGKCQSCDDSDLIPDLPF